MEASSQDIKRLASFPEQNPNPVIELTNKGELTYNNPAATRYFPDLHTKLLEHPVFSEVKKIIKSGDFEKINGFKTELSIGTNIFEQKLFRFEESGLIRIYCSDVTEQKRNEEKLAQLALFPIQNPNPVLEVNADLNLVTFKNPAAERLFAGMSEVKQGHPILKEIQKRAAEKTDFVTEVKIENKYFEQKVFFIRNTNLVRIYLHDLTERKNNERNLARLASFPEQNPNPIVEFDTTGNITYTNQACQSLFPGLIAQGFAHFLLKPFETNFRRIVSGEISDSVEEIKADRFFYIQRARFMPEMGLVRVFHTDITSQKAAEEIIREKNKDITDSINYARRIQRSILPTDTDLATILEDYFVLYLPKDIVSGDFYWANSVTTDDSERQRYSLVAAVDCTGHGVPGAFMSIVGSTLLNQTINNPNVNSPAQALDYLNAELPKNLRAQSVDEQIRDGMDMTMVAINRSKLKMHFCGANNPIYILQNRDSKKELVEIKPDKQPISGSTTDVKKPFTNHTIDVQKGDIVYLFTDGYADQFGGPKGKKFKYKQLQEKLREFSDMPMKKQREKLERTFLDWKGNLEQVDDVLIIGIRI